ncbi:MULTISPECIES: hypothetical protein [Amycolatopsis]|uniref:Uncharacterized protein n=1 Tax=Amycolatopsis albidoflavus TaxID=102226 RepID=A0ABW5IEC3_9PSEU
MRLSQKAGMVASALTLTTGLATSTAVAAPSAASAATRPSIASVSFSGSGGSGVASPTITLTGSGFGAAPPPSTPDNVTSCGTYTNNGFVFGNQFHFLDDNNFEAGASNPDGSANCIGIIPLSWNDSQVVLRFGNAYGTFAHWYLSNGDGYAISAKDGLFGGTVSGLN